MAYGDSYMHYTASSGRFSMHKQGNTFGIGKSVSTLKMVDTGSTMKQTGAAIVGEKGNISVQRMQAVLAERDNLEREIQEECPQISDVEERYSLSKYQAFIPEESVLKIMGRNDLSQNLVRDE